MARGSATQTWLERVEAHYLAGWVAEGGHPIDNNREGPSGLSVGRKAYHKPAGSARARRYQKPVYRAHSNYSLHAIEGFGSRLRSVLVENTEFEPRGGIRRNLRLTPNVDYA